MSHEEMEAVPKIKIFQARDYTEESLLDLYPPTISYEVFKNHMISPETGKLFDWFRKINFYVRKKDYYLHTCKLRDILV